ITAGTVLGDLIGFTGFFLLGELSTRFVLKSLIVLVICGGIFIYYMSSLPGGSRAWSFLGRSQHRLFASLSMAIVAATFVAGMVVAGNPADQRRLQADQRRVDDLRQIAHAVEQWRAEARAQSQSTETPTTPSAAAAVKPDPGLPETTEILRAQHRVVRTTDPETSMPYKYEIVGRTTYRLCATFSAPSPNEDSGFRNRSQFWVHPQGPHCFVLDAAKTVPW
ncbi:MAG: hypothetical protein KIT83_17015, partial [Bryobacterales bacterium]|nr:hypothetical protein [Bryobacterales bacterium]